MSTEWILAGMLLVVVCGGLAGWWWTNKHPGN